MDYKLLIQKSSPLYETLIKLIQKSTKNDNVL